MNELISPHSSVNKESACSAGDLGSIPGLGRSPAEGNGNPLQYSCLENPKVRGAGQATVHWTSRVRHYLVTKPPPFYSYQHVKIQKTSYKVKNVSLKKVDNIYHRGNIIYCLWINIHL